MKNYGNCKRSSQIIHGAWDTAIVAPFKFGMFLGELAGKEHKIKEKIEFMV